MTYSDELLKVLVNQSSNELFYMGNIQEGAKVIIFVAEYNAKIKSLL